MLNNARLGGLLFLCLSGAYGYFATEIPLDYFSRQETFTARTLPYFISAAGVLVSLLLLLTPSLPTDWARLRDLRWMPAGLLLMLMFAYGAVLESLGFPLATIAFLITAWFVMGERRPVWLFGLSIPLTFGFWLLMDQLGIYLYPGDLIEPWIGRS